MLNSTKKAKTNLFSLDQLSGFFALLSKQNPPLILVSGQIQEALAQIDFPQFFLSFCITDNLEGEGSALIKTI